MLCHELTIGQATSSSPEGLTCIERRRRPLGVGGRGHGELPQHPQLLQLDVVSHVGVVQKPPAAAPSSN